MVGEQTWIQSYPDCQIDCFHLQNQDPAARLFVLSARNDRTSKLSSALPCPPFILWIFFWKWLGDQLTERFYLSIEFARGNDPTPLKHYGGMKQFYSPDLKDSTGEKELEPSRERKRNNRLDHLLTLEKDSQYLFHLAITRPEHLKTLELSFHEDSRLLDRGTNQRRRFGLIQLPAPLATEDSSLASNYLGEFGLLLAVLAASRCRREQGSTRRSFDRAAGSEIDRER